MLTLAYADQQQSMPTLIYADHQWSMLTYAYQQWCAHGHRCLLLVVLSCQIHVAIQNGATHLGDLNVKLACHLQQASWAEAGDSRCWQSWNLGLQTEFHGSGISKFRHLHSLLSLQSIFLVRKSNLSTNHHSTHNHQVEHQPSFHSQPPSWAPTIIPLTTNKLSTNHHSTHNQQVEHQPSFHSKPTSWAPAIIPLTTNKLSTSQHCTHNQQKMITSGRMRSIHLSRELINLDMLTRLEPRSPDSHSSIAVCSHHRHSVEWMARKDGDCQVQMKGTWWQTLSRWRAESEWCL